MVFFGGECQSEKVLLLGRGNLKKLTCYKLCKIIRIFNNNVKEKLGSK